MTNPSDKLSVTFDLGFLAHLALEAASKMPQFKGSELSSEASYYQGDESMLDGIIVTGEFKHAPNK